MTIKILGPGCTNCRTLAARTQEAVQQLCLAATIEKVEDFQTIASYGILRTPGLVIDEKVVSSGTVPRVEELRALLMKSAGTA
jgi:small redox-active disulfide protein 2